MSIIGFNQTINIPVVSGSSVVVASGPSQGASLTFADDLQPGEIYHLIESGNKRKFSIQGRDYENDVIIAPESMVGKPGNRVALDCTLTFMSTDNHKFLLTVFVELQDGLVVGSYCHFNGSPIQDKDYVLILIDKTCEDFVRDFLFGDVKTIPSRSIIRAEIKSRRVSS